MPASSPAEHANAVVNLSIIVNGSKAPDTLQVISVRIESEVNRPAHAVLVFPADEPHESGEVCAMLAGWVGGSIEIKAGYGHDEAVVFAGVARKLRIDIGAERQLLVIEASDAMTELEGLPGYRSFSNVKHSDIFSMVVQAIGATADAHATAVNYEQVVQGGLPDLEFLLSLVEQSGGYLASAGAKKLEWKPFELAPDAAIKVTLGEDMMGFAGLVRAPRWKTVKVEAWSVLDGEVIWAEAPVPESKGQGNLVVRRSVVSKQEGQELATAHAMRIALSMQEGSGICQGTALVKVGGGVEIAGTKKFDKTYFVSKVVQVIKDGNWLTEFSTGLSPAQLDTFAPAPPQGPVVGRVKSLKNDPEAGGRVLLVCPALIEEGKDLGWAHVSSPFGKASSWMPDIGDQVLVSFIGGDLSAPVVVGSLSGKRDNRPLNDEALMKGEKLLATGAMKVHFNPDKDSITLDNGKGQSMTIGGQDRDIKLAAAKITADAGAKLVLDSGGGVVSVAGANLAVSTNGATLAGPVVTITSGSVMTIDAPTGLNVNKGALEVI